MFSGRLPSFGCPEASRSFGPAKRTTRLPETVPPSSCPTTSSPTFLPGSTRYSAGPAPTMIVPSPGSTVTELIAGLAPLLLPPSSVGGALVSAGGAVCSGTAVSLAGGCSATGGSASSPPQPARTSTAITHARASTRSLRTGEPHPSRRHLDRSEEMLDELRLGVGLLRMTHCGVHRAAAIVAVAPGQRTRLVELGEHVGVRLRAELVPLVGTRPGRRQAAGRGRAAVDDVDGALGHAGVVAREARPDEALVPRPAPAGVRGRVHAEVAAAAADEALE